MVPYDTKLVDGEEVYKKYAEKYFTPAGLSLTSKKDALLSMFANTLDECLAGLPVDFVGYIREQGLQNARHAQNAEEYQMSRLKSSVSAYFEFYRLRKDLIDFVDYFTNWRKHGYVSIGSGGLFGLDGRAVGLPNAQAAFIKKDAKDGWRVTVEPTGLSAALDGIIGDRLRSCEICSKIFWARRKESETCSGKCSNKLRVRRHRETPEKK